jgi:hypothetical protein
LRIDQRGGRTDHSVLRAGGLLSFSSRWTDHRHPLAGCPQASLAASNLVQLGFYRAGDVIGGFEAWKDVGLPVEPCRQALGSVDMLSGAGPPD